VVAELQDGLNAKMRNRNAGSFILVGFCWLQLAIEVPHFNLCSEQENFSNQLRLSITAICFLHPM
jgi:hypothetical protein